MTLAEWKRRLGRPYRWVLVRWLLQRADRFAVSRYMTWRDARGI